MYEVSEIAISTEELLHLDQADISTNYQEENYIQDSMEKVLDMPQKNKRSERLHLKSERGQSFVHYGDQYHYNFDEFNWDEAESDLQRPRASSWSSAGLGAAVVERRVRSKESDQSQVQSQPKVQRPKKGRRSQLKQVDYHLQQRIDNFLRQTHMSATDEDNTEVQFKAAAEKLLPSQKVLNTLVSTSAIKLTPTPAQCEYGSDFESITEDFPSNHSLAVALAISTTVDKRNPNQMQGQQSMENMASGTDNHGNREDGQWGDLLSRMRQMIKEEFAKEKESNQQENKELIQQTVKEELV